LRDCYREAFIGDVFAAERIQPDIHRAVIDDLNFIKIELGMIPQVIFDNFRQRSSVAER
jgi:hypothetical protein